MANTILEIEKYEGEPNYRAWTLILLLIGISLIFCIPMLTETPSGYYKDANGKNIPIPDGWIRLKNGTVIPLSTPAPIIITNTVYITPTPDNGIYYSSETENGTRKMQRYFVFHRNDVLGYKDLTFKTTVYGYKFLDSYHWYNWHDAQWYEAIPQGNNTKFLFIYVQTYLDDISGDDVRSFLPDEQHYWVEYLGVLNAPIQFEKDIYIHEFENTYNFNDDYIIQYYGQKILTPLTGSEAGKPKSDKHYYIYGGKSNAEDGFIVYEVPKEAQADDITVYGGFWAYGEAQWKLKL